MNGVDLLLTSGLVSAVGWALVHFLWQGCVIAVLFWLVCVLSRRESAHLRYWAGVGGLGLSALALGTTFAIYLEPAAEFIPAPAVPESVNTFLVLSGSAPDAWGLLQDGIEPILPLVVVLWLAGVLVLSARTAVDWVRVRRLVRRGVSEVSDTVLASARRLEQQLGVSRAVRVLQSGRVSVPMAVGWIRPVILIPAGVLARLPHDQLEMVLAHELGHIRRFDHVINWFQIALETLLFYHPAIRWMSRRIREEREDCCDDLVVARCRRPATYARALANLEMLRTPAMATAVMAATGGNLLGRIRRIIDQELPRTSTGYAQISLMAALALIVGLGAHQGLSLSRALNQVASIAHLQPSDVEWKTWGRSRAAWGEGLEGFAERADELFRTSEPEPAAPEPVVAPQERESNNHAADGGSVAMKSAEPETQASPARADRAPAAWPVAAAPAEISADPVFFARAPQPTAASLDLPPEQPVQQPVQQPIELPAEQAGEQLVVLERVEPRYPWRARANDLEGFVELAFNIDEDGRAYDIEIVDSIPSGIFDRAAKRAMKKWRFAPQPLVSEDQRLTQTFDFELEDEPRQESRRRNCAMTGRRTCSQAPSSAIVVYVNPPRDREDIRSRSLLN